VHGRNIVPNTLDIIAALELIEEDLRRRENKGVMMHEGSTSLCASSTSITVAATARRRR
jgi:hypothetical protein